MTKEVLVRISGSHQMDDDKNVVELIVPGEYYFRNGKHFVIYNEVMEKNMEPVHNLAKITEDSLEITKNGQVSSRMQFEYHKKIESNYMTPVGKMLVGVDTRAIRVTESQDALKVEVEYSVELNYEHTSDCIFVMEITSKTETELDLGRDTENPEDNI